MYEYKHSEEERQHMQEKVAKLKRENSLGSTLESQISANEHVIKQLEMFINQKVYVGENYVPVELTLEERQVQDKREKVGEELYRIRCIKAHIDSLKEEVARQEYIVAQAEANMRENGLGYLL
ncbi:hypothetical protein OCE55_28795 [Bacillus paranthracis]|uniref:hypothetical protein n=1 Tax=Bacillus cereus group TaxID=86661 RepID=UPI001F59AA2A|nr:MULTISPECIES: hypothetical protein [Bacillus cereus group]MCU5391990.1 hypothetical protein [Bacillus paranthracis]